jgi:hypothetical protein
MPDTAALHAPISDRAEISRRNGALSRGPVTPEGKARSALNATRHGLCARTLVLEDGEDAMALADLRAALFARWQPADAIEAHRVEELVFAAWREVRLREVEDAVLARAAAGAPPDPGLPSFATLLRYRARITRDARAATEELLALRRGRGVITDPAQLRWLARKIEQAQAILADGAAPPDGSGECTNELLPGTNEPAVAAAPDGAAPPERTDGWLPGTNEPRHGLPPLIVTRSEAAAAPNRHARRRLAALARRGLPAAA